MSIRRSIKQRAALKAYMTKKMEIDTMLARLVKANDDHYNVNPDEIHWGHVGDITGTAENLKAITDSVFKEGEYAE